MQGRLGNYYVYPPISWPKIEEIFCNISPSKWDYKGDEFGTFPDIEGFYKVDDRLHKEIDKLLNKKDQ